AQTFWHRVLPFIFLFFIVSTAYLNADHEEFIFDSRLPLIDNPEDTVNVNKIIKLFWEGKLNPDAPFAFLTFALNYKFNTAIGLDGFDITTFLVFNIIIHALNACLLYILVRSFLGYLKPDEEPGIFIPLAAATLFAVHPIAASSVAYIIQRRGSLATMFYLLAILSYLRVRYYPQFQKLRADTAKDKSDKKISPWPWQRIFLVAIIPVLYWFSFRSKNLGVVLPFAILAIEFCLRATNRRALLRYLAVLIPGGMVCVIGMFFFLWIRGLFDPATMTVHHFGPETPWGPWYHFLTEARVFFHYWKLLLLPLPMWSCIDHGFELSTHLLHHGSIIAIGLHAILFVLAIVAALRGYTLGAIGFFWFYVALIPYAALPQIELFVEYKTYLPSIGVALILAEVLCRIRHRISINKQASVVAIVATLLLITTVYRNHIYRDRFHAWGDAVKKSPNHARPHVNFGNALVRKGESELQKGKKAEADKHFKEAKGHYERAIEIRPGYPEAHIHYGNMLVLEGKYD
ncbi:MAG: hypothetical protein JSV03_00180, partial [Planctomycetota bacterium]